MVYGDQPLPAGPLREEAPAVGPPASWAGPRLVQQGAGLAWWAAGVAAAFVHAASGQPRFDSEAAGVDGGYVGLTVGRTIWFDTLADHVAGRCDRGSTRTRIAEKYQKMIDAYKHGASRPSRDRVASGVGEATLDDSRA